MGKAENPALWNSDVTDMKKFHKVYTIVEYLRSSKLVKPITLTRSTCNCTY